MKSLTSRTRILAMSIVASVMVNPAWSGEAKIDSDKLVGQQVDIAPSAYQYRSDRKPDENPPESWLALMRYANLPLNKPVDVTAPVIKQALCGFLWEEIRRCNELELTWSSDAGRQPAPDELVVTTLNNQGASSSWWNNLTAAKKSVAPTVSSDGKTYVYLLGTDTCGLVVSVVGRDASDYAVPTAQVLVAEKWKKMDVEIEWGFDQSAVGKDYSGTDRNL